MKKTFLGLIVAASLAVAGCGNGDDDGGTGVAPATQPVTVHVTDAPLDTSRIQGVLVPIQRLELRSDAGATTLIDDPTAPGVDVFRLRNGELRTLGSGPAPVGSYSSATITFGEVVVLLTGGGELRSLPAPFRVTVPAAVTVDAPRELIVDVDLARSLFLEGTGDVPTGFVFQPVVRVVQADTGGTVRGAVVGPPTPPSGATVELRNSGGEVLLTTLTNQDGAYAFVAVPEGAYEVATPGGTSAPVTAVRGATTTANLVVEGNPTNGGQSGGQSGGQNGGTNPPASDIALLDVSAQQSVQPGEQIRITWQVRSALPIKATSARWGGVSGVYSGVGTTFSSPEGGTISFSEVFLAPSRAVNVFYKVRAEDVNGTVVESPEKVIRIEWTEMTGALVYEARPGVTIPDNDPQGVTIPFEVDEPGKLANLQVRIDITHPARTDLVLDLIAPSGKKLRLYALEPGQPDPNHVGSTHSDIYGTFNGTFRTTEDVTTMFGESIQGTWKLHVFDRIPDGEGTLYLATLMLQLRAEDDNTSPERFPDLVTLPPDEVSTFFNSEGRHIRLSNSVANHGTGPLEVRGQVDRNTGETWAYQRVFKLGQDSRGRPIWEVVRERLAGRFVFAAHKDHNHFHFDEFAVYTLCDLSWRRLAASTKVSHCLEDYKFVAPEVQHSRNARVFACTPTIQGISLGWADYYGANLEGQQIKITGIPDGEYYLLSEATHAFDESNPDKRNNSAASRIRIVERDITVLEKLDGIEVDRRRRAAGAP